MINWDDIDTRHAETRFAVANSPMFLFDGLRSDGEVIKLAARYSSQEILRSFVKVTSAEGIGNTLSKQVRPFILIAAATLKDDQSLLVELERLADGVGGWVALLAAAARESPPPPSFRSIISQTTFAPSASVAGKNSIPTTQKNLVLS